jgi:hypothetical protein
MERIPSASEINVHDTPEERLACLHFSGATREDIRDRIQDDGMMLQEDLMWMGPTAFNFYLGAFIDYIQSEQARGDDFIVYSLYNTIEFRLYYENKSLDYEKISILVDTVISLYDRFDVDDNAYGDLKKKYSELSRRISAMLGRG